MNTLSTTSNFSTLFNKINEIVVAINQLETTKGLTLLSREINETIAEQRKRWDEGIGYQEREIIEAFLSLPVPQRRVLREVIEAFVKAYSTEVTRAP